MKISILTSVFYQKLKEVEGEDRIIFGGAERYLVELCKLLQDEGHTVIVYQGASCDNVINKKYMGIDIVCLPLKSAEWEYHTCAALNIMFYELSLTSDLRIYFANFLAYPLVKSPSISINHGIFWDYPGGFLSKFNEPERQEFYKRQLFGMTEPDMCVAVDTNVRNSIACMSPGSERRIIYIPNFVDTKEFYPVKERNWDKIRILYPRRLVQLRGINEFILSAIELPQYDFILCGQAFDEAVEEKLQNFNGYPNVFLTMRPMERMAEVYRESDIAVIPTRASEGTSLSCLEAMATGLPIVTTPAGGLPNLVIDRFNGLVVDLNHYSLTDSIKELAESSDLRYNFGVRNLELVKSSFSINLWREKWLKVINRVIK